MNKKQLASVKVHLDKALQHYNQHSFIEKDPISIPHRFTRKQDIEIAGFFAAIFAWGNRTTIINKCQELMQLMDNAPFAFITQHQEMDLKRLLDFKHRTFNATDVLHFIRMLRHHYTQGFRKSGGTEPTLESAFTIGLKKKDSTIETGLINLHHYFFSLEDSPARSKKHLSTPENNSSCKRLNMFLRWMVRKDEAEVDFGIWKNIRQDQLVCPLDVHVQRIAFQLGLIKEQKADWKTAVELTENLRLLDPIDPVKYDLALFSLGIRN